MLTRELSQLFVEQKAIASRFLNRQVIIDCYVPRHLLSPGSLSLLLINDGQELEEMRFPSLLNQMMEAGEIGPVLCVGIHAGRNRKNEYGTAGQTDYEGRGERAGAYHRFILEELIPFIHIHYAMEQFIRKGFLGFSLGGLTALDMVWNHPHVFSIAGVFSGSLWWRSRALDAGYDDDRDRIMHQQIRKGPYRPGLRFYFTTGSMDETADRNQNGIIDSIDDTLDLINELRQLGYDSEYEVAYVNFAEGKHDVQTWANALPGFLLWGWSRKEDSLARG